MRLPINLKPGIVSGGAPSSGLGRFVDSNLVRWVGDSILPVGGWAKNCATSVQGMARAALAWRQNDYTLRVGIGTHQKLYVLSGGNLYDVTPAGFVTGRPDSVAGFGYSYGKYGHSAYGGSGVPGEVIDASVWALDTWGQELVGCCGSDGRLWTWKNVLTAPAVQIPNSPIGCSGVLVTPERHLIAIGPNGDKFTIAWSDSEDYTTWTALDTNSAGSLRLATRTPILAFLRSKAETLLFTQDEIYTLNYLGYPYVYGASRIASGTGIAGPNAGVTLEAGAVWMTRAGFFNYNGAITQIRCDIFNDIVADVNWVQRQKITAASMSRTGEVWWFYPSTDSVEIDRYAAWNTREGTWATGRLTRTAWADAGVLRHALGVDEQGHVYDHEQGFTADGAPIAGQRYVHTGPICMGGGATTMQVSRLYSDANVPLEVTFYGRNELADEPWVYGPYTGLGTIDVRLSARYVDIQIRFTQDTDWRAGSFSIEAVAGGTR